MEPEKEYPAGRFKRFSNGHFLFLAKGLVV